VIPTRLDVLLEDDELLVVNKPSGLLVHRGMDNDPVTLVDLVATHLNAKRTFPLHRLDRGTSGVILFAKSGEAAATLQEQFTDHTITRHYVALVRGEFPEQIWVDHPVPRGEGKERVAAQTDFERIRVYDIEPRTVSLVRAIPKTGRFHQIRRHLKHLSHPIIGDANYGKGALNREFCARYGLCRLALHAEFLAFKHPTTQTRVEVRSETPAFLMID